MSRKRTEPASPSPSLISASVHGMRSFDLQSVVFDTLGYSRTAFAAETTSRLKTFLTYLLEFAALPVGEFTALPRTTQRTTAAASKFPPPDGALTFFEVCWLVWCVVMSIAHMRACRSARRTETNPKPRLQT